MDKHQLWQATLGELELTLSKANFMTWFKNTFIVSYENDRVVIGVPNTFTKAWFEKKYHSSILKSLQAISENRIKEVRYQVEAQKNTVPDSTSSVSIEKITKISENNQRPQNAIHEIGLNPQYTFSNFVIGKGNELAQAASMAASEKPGRVYNPLYLYGGVGLGKTHLLQAIGNGVITADPEKKVLYVSCEKFTNDFIKAISSKIIDKFKTIYRSVDVLLIDDIQFLSGKEGTQEEFFHTFNALHQNNKQIVISSDRPPKAISSLEERLISRFEWGMIADISSPDYETRLAILETKCKEKGLRLDPEVLQYIASNIQNNVRELEGALNRIIAYTQLNNSESAVEIAKKIIQTAETPTRQITTITPRVIISTVATHFDVNEEDIMGACRKKSFAVPRQIIMFLMREEINSSYPAIGQEIGNRDHTTAMHAYLKIKTGIENDQKIKQHIKIIRDRLYNNS